MYVKCTFLTYHFPDLITNERISCINKILRVCILIATSLFCLIGSQTSTAAVDPRHVKVEVAD